MRNNIIDILARLIFVSWIISGILTFTFALAGKDDWAILFSFLFLAPIIIGLIYTIAKWIVTGSSD